jgi:hypothetical protein
MHFISEELENYVEQHGRMIELVKYENPSEKNIQTHSRRVLEFLK